MAAYADTIARQFTQGLRTNRHKSLWEGRFLLHPSFIGGVCVNDQDSPEALYSYGPHYPVVIKEQDPGYTTERYQYWVNETPYYVTDIDRDIAGWGPRNERRKQSPSPTTNGHCRAVERALTIAGYAPTNITKTVDTENTNSGDPMTHALRLWVRS